MTRKVFLIQAVVLLAAGGCSHELEGPSPEVTGLDPALVCTEQLTTEVTITGENLSPAEVDSLTEDPSLALPAVSLLPSQTLAGEPAAADAAPLGIPVGKLTWTSHQSMTMQVDPALALPPGVYHLRLENRNGNFTVLEDGLVAVPPPELHAIEPDLICTAQGPNILILSGEGFLRVGDELPEVTFSGGHTFTAASLDDCIPLPGPVADAERCDTLVLELATDDLAPGAYGVHVTNPMPAGCASTEEVTLAVVPPPALDAIDPDLICTRQIENTLTLTGTGFLDVEGTLPTVAIGGNDFTATSLDDCTQVEGTLLDARSCTTLTLVLPPESLPAGAHDVVVTNPEPAACSSEEDRTLAAVDPPVIDAVDPDLICLDEADMTLTVSGAGFLDVEGVLPTVLIDGAEITADAVSDCTPVAGTLLDAHACATLTVTIPQATLPAGSYQLNVRNPEPAACVSEQGVSFAVVEAPELLSIEPELVCNAQGDDPLTLTGEEFLDVDGVLPTVTIAGQTFPATSVDGCEDVPGTATPTRRCTSLTVTIPESSLFDGAHEVVVTNPPPAACSSPAGPMLYVTPPPEVTASQTSPPCTQDPDTLVLTGTGFLVVGGEPPVVLVESTEVVVTATDGCTTLAGPQAAVESCTRMTLALPAGLLGLGTYEVEVFNPNPPGCRALFESAIGLPPTLDSISPVRICETGGQITVNGSGFLDGAVVSIGDTDVATTFVSDSQLLADVPSGFAGGLYDVTVTNPDGCSATLEQVLQIIELPLVYYVDPPVVYNGINTQVTVFASGIAGDVIDVSIRPTGQAGPVTALEYIFNPARANRIQAIIPQGTDPGAYDVIVSDDVGCVAELIDGFAVTDTLTLALDLVDPPFGWTAEDTSVVVYAEDPVSAPDEQFLRTPRVYLNPVNAGADTVATALESATFVDPVRVNAVVPAGLPMGSYDLVAVNPDGAVGLLPEAFEVTEEAPPVVDNITPGSVINQAGQVVDVEGNNFRNPAVEATCRPPAGADILITGLVGPFDQTNISVTFDMTAADPGSVCVVRVTNDDGTYFDYSALSVTNPAQNLSSFTAEFPMGTARVAPASAAGRPTRSARFLYAFGGDDGEGTVLDSAEAAPVDPYGALGAWFALPYPLPAPRTLAGAVTIGRFIYLVGGSDAAATGTVYRAEVLRPGDAPEITDADIRLGEGTGLAGGVWTYRVAAVFPPGDDRNPDGESLASDPLVIQIPDRDERIHVTVVWSEVTRASGYRIYRSPDPDLAGGSELLIAEVPASPRTYTDTGDAAGVQAPLPFGSLGAWATMPAMFAAREGAGIVAARDPAVPSIAYLYALGGRDENGTALASYEYLPITLEADGTHTVGTWVAGIEDLPVARWQLGAFLADHAHADVVPVGDTWIYAGAGVASNGTTTRNAVHAAQVQVGGDLGAWTNVTGMTPARAGYGFTLANSTLYAFGGLQAGASDEGASSQILGPPGLGNWNNLGLNMTEPRYLQGSVTESAFIFQLGGWNGTAATASVEKTVW